jgi:hypothetical protein
VASSFVDCHSHVVPSGDDGARTLGEGRSSAGWPPSGTEVLYRTPHVWPHLVLTSKREAGSSRPSSGSATSAPGAGSVRADAFEGVADQDPARYVLEGTQLVLVEVLLRPADDARAG